MLTITNVAKKDTDVLLKKLKVNSMMQEDKRLLRFLVEIAVTFALMKAIKDLSLL